MAIDRKEDYFYFKFVCVHSTLSANKGIFLDYNSYNNYSTVKNQPYQDLENLKLVWFLQTRPWNPRGLCSWILRGT